MKTRIVFGALVGLLLTAGEVMACSTCISGSTNPNVLNAFYVATILLIGAALTILGGFYFLLYKYSRGTVETKSPPLP